MKTSTATVFNRHQTKSGSYVYHLVDEMRHCHRAFSSKLYDIDQTVNIVELNFKTYIIEGVNKQ